MFCLFPNRPLFYQLSSRTVVFCSPCSILPRFVPFLPFSMNCHAQPCPMLIYAIYNQLFSTELSCTALSYTDLYQYHLPECHTLPCPTLICSLLFCQVLIVFSNYLSCPYVHYQQPSNKLSCTVPIQSSLLLYYPWTSVTLCPVPPCPLSLP